MQAALVLLAACASAERVSLATPTIDTLPSGVVSVTSPGPTAWADTNGWQLVETLRVQGAEGGPGELIEPQSVMLDAVGRVYVADTKPATVKVFDRDGRFVRTIGGEGEGPGEFRAAFLAVHQGHLIVHDPQVTRTSIFDTAGTFVRSWPSACCFWAAIGADRMGRISVPTITMSTPDAQPGMRYTRYRLDGTLIDTLVVPGRDEGKGWTVKQGNPMMRPMSTGIPLTPSVDHALSPDGGVVYGWSGEYRLVESTIGSDTVALFGREWTPVPVTDERRTSIVDRMVERMGQDWDEATLREAFRTSDIPATAPAFERIGIDAAGNRWLWIDAGADTTRTVFDVFDPTGVYLGVVHGPRSLSVYAVHWGDDEVVAIEEDADGLPVVVRYRVVRP